MNSGWRIAPIILLVFVVVSFAWRIVKPEDPAIRSQLISRPVPAFALAPAVPGKAGLTSADLADGRPRLLNVFASWCVPCATEARVLGELRARGAPIDAIAIRDTPAAIAAFLDRNGDPYRRIGDDPNSNVQMAFGSSGVPETFVIDGRGVVRYQYIGPLTRSNIPDVLKQLDELR